MHPVFQEIIQMATTKLKEVLEQVASENSIGGWDPHAMEQEVRQFTRQLGRRCLESWSQVRSQQAEAQARFCGCGQRRRVHKRQSFWWLSTFGPVETEVPHLRCPKGHGRDRPFQRLTGLCCRGKSLALQRVLSDFGAEKSFSQASQQLREHYGVALHPSSVRQVVMAQAQRAAGLSATEDQGAIREYQSQRSFRSGEPWLIVESDGSMVRTGELTPHPEGGLSPKRKRPKRHRRTQWREVRLSTGQVPQEETRQYGAVLGSPPGGRKADLCPSP